MKSKLIILIFSILTIVLSCDTDNPPGGNPDMIIDHTCINLNAIPEHWIQEAKNNLYIAYGHTSHGSQLITGMHGLIEFKSDLYSYANEDSDETLHIHDRGLSGDLGNPDRTTWEEVTRDYISNHPSVNVIIWSWCGQVSSANDSDISTYINLMQGLENDYPSIKFVYMTGHLDGTGLEGNLHLRNEQIRTFCRNNNKILYDFADIESYNPDGVYFGDKIPNDNCDYDSDEDGQRDSNWAEEWQQSHTEDVDWYSCSSAHSQSLNANMKAYAAWYLWARLAGWDG